MIWIIGILVIPFMVLHELTKPKNLYRGGWYSKGRGRRRRK